jgi:SAM-dependent methyltransferase
MENSGDERAEQVISRLSVDDNTSVIDIGCGPGTVTIPLARVARTVTAIDPAHAMIRKLEESARSERLRNINTLNKKWEDIVFNQDLVAHDIVVASYSLIMEDIREALEKMNVLATQGVCLFWFAGRQTWGYDLLWLKLFGEPFVAGPSHIYLLNVLNQMGIYPNVEITRRTHVQRFASFDEAVQNWRENFPQITIEQDQIIREHVSNSLQDEDGTYSSRSNVTTAMIWWRNDGV